MINIHFSKVYYKGFYERIDIARTKAINEGKHIIAELDRQGANVVRYYKVKGESIFAIKEKDINIIFQ